jgi:16S rRNA (guanine527-N7)-methyltransferase
LKLLAKWNATVNLTSLQIDPPDAAAIERLIEEPVRAARFVRPADRLAVDLGSGGGSPALPLKIACPWLRFVLVESRGRKCAFLREVVRELELELVEVVHGRFEDVASRSDLAAQADLVTCRAIRPDDQFWSAVSELLAPSGRVLWFGGNERGIPRSFKSEDVDGSTFRLTKSRTGA